MKRKDANLMICKIESQALKDYFSTLPYGEARRIKNEVLDMLVPHLGEDSQYAQKRKALKRSLENWIQGQCRIPYVAKLSFNKVIGHELLLPYDNYYSIVTVMPDSILLDCMLRNKQWLLETAMYFDLDLDAFIPIFKEFCKVRLDLKKQCPDVEDCINHLENWLKSFKGIKKSASSDGTPPRPYIQEV